MVRRSMTLLAVLAVVASACEGEPPPKTGLTYTANAEHAYEAAMKEFNAHNWAESQPLFSEVKRKFSYTKQARLAELRYADADFEQEKYAEALREYKQFIHDHRSDAENVEYARERVAETNYKQISDSFLLPSSDERDQGAIQDAYTDLLAFLKDYPKSKQTPHACSLLEDVIARLVRHELYVARFYLARDNFEAAVSRVQYAMRHYAGNEACPPGRADETKPENAFGLVPDALLLLGETYLRMHRPEDARTAFETIVTRYPQSELVVQAKKYLGS
ncbi:MAG TPA: outer membrane protein assembly factor BamD [Polyangiaceae bacterium]|nr:outer membrane protein assembly factor BamD [Polyangiaceae bacterium]